MCHRCLRKGALCSYSSSLPKGRPSLYRLDEVAVGSKGPGETPGASSTSPATTPATTAIPPTHITHGDTIPGSQAADVNADADADVDTNAGVDMDVEISTSSSAKPSLNGVEAFVLPDSMDMFIDFQASWWLPEDLIGDNMLDRSLDSTSNWDLTTEAQLHASPEVSSPFLSDSSGASTESKGGAGQGHPCEKGLNLEADLAENSSMSSSSSYCGVVFTADSNGFELSIAHLSRLCMRLSQLLSRCFLAETLDQSRPSKDHDPASEDQSIIDTVFKSIHSWLVHGSANTNLSHDPESLHGARMTGDLLHHVFSASNHLREILRYQHSSSLHAETTTRSLREASRSSQHSCSVVHHLVLACITLLLKIYVAILIALQRSADALSSSLLARYLVEPSDYMDAASRGHIKLVSVVQLCSYFIKGQNQTFDTILSSQGSVHAPSSQENDPRQSVWSDATYRLAIEEMTDLKTEVEQRLKRLQDSLCIFT